MLFCPVCPCLGSVPLYPEVTRRQAVSVSVAVLGSIQHKHIQNTNRNKIVSTPREKSHLTMSIRTQSNGMRRVSRLSSILSVEQPYATSDALNVDISVTGSRLSKSTRPRPVQVVLDKIEFRIDITSSTTFTADMLEALNSKKAKEWTAMQGDYHVRMDLDLLSKRENSSIATLVVFSVDASMLVQDKTWSTVECHVVNDFIRADNCKDGGSENKLFYKNALSLKQFILHDLPQEEKSQVFEIAYQLFVGDEKVPGLSNIQTFSGIPFFHMKPFSH